MRNRVASVRGNVRKGVGANKRLRNVLFHRLIDLISEGSKPSLLRVRFKKVHIFGSANSVVDSDSKK